MVVQVGKGLASECFGGGAIELSQSRISGDNEIWVAYCKVYNLVPYIFVVLGVCVGCYLVAKLVVVGDILLERAREPLAQISPLCKVAHRAVVHREAGLQGTTKRRHLCLGECGVALQAPKRHKEQTYGRALLTYQVAEYANKASVKVVVLHCVTIFVGSELLEPRHRVTAHRRRREYLDTLWQPHHHTIRREVLGVNYKGDLHRTVSEAEVDRWLHRSGVVHHLVAERPTGVGVDDIDLFALELMPLHIGAIGTPRVVLCRCRRCTQEGNQGEYDMFNPLFQFKIYFLRPLRLNTLSQKSR